MTILHHEHLQAQVLDSDYCQRNCVEVRYQNTLTCEDAPGHKTDI